MLFAAASGAAGVGFGRILPRDWGYIAPYGLLLGAAVYLFGFHGLLGGSRRGRRRVRVPGRGAANVLPRGLLRAGLLLACNAALLYISYGMRERVDLTWPLATLASWSLLESWMDRSETEEPNAPAPAGALALTRDER
jgi:hypothetical protein